MEWIKISYENVRNSYEKLVYEVIIHIPLRKYRLYTYCIYIRSNMILSKEDFHNFHKFKHGDNGEKKKQMKSVYTYCVNICIF